MRSESSASFLWPLVVILLKKKMETYKNDFITDVYDLLSRYPVTFAAPHCALLDPSGKLLCSVMRLPSHPFNRVWFCTLLADLEVRKENNLCLLDRVELRKNDELFFYPVSFSTYQTLVPVPPLYSGKCYDNVKTVTVRLD